MSIITAYFYTTGGRITGTRTGNRINVEADVKESGDSAVIVEGGELSNTDELYVNSLAKLAKKSKLTTLEYPEVVNVGDNIVITGLPSNTEITWPDNSRTTVSGSATYEATIPANYSFVIDHPSYSVEKFTVLTDPLGEDLTSVEDFTVDGTIVAKNYREGTYELTGTTPVINPKNGGIQTWLLTGNSTPTEALVNGDSVTVMIDDSSGFTVTWTLVDMWNGGSPPTLAETGYTIVELWKVNGTVFAAHVGDFS